MIVATLLLLLPQLLIASIVTVYATLEFKLVMLIQVSFVKQNPAEHKPVLGGGVIVTLYI